MASKSSPLTKRILNTLQEFLRLESAGGLVLMGAAVLAMIVANSPLAMPYLRALDFPLQISAGDFKIAKPLILWINDGLMAVFFLLVGLELKREIVEGHLSNLRSASLPAFAAVGGMAAPAAIYATFNWGDPLAMRGWAIPAATDIAFALGALSLLGSRAPVALKAFLLSLAIFDDLGAIIIIAVFYTAELSTAALLTAAVLILGLAALNRAGVRSPAVYLLLGVPLWVATLKSGVHATLAGVVLALFIPIRPPRGAAPDEEGEDSPLRHLEHVLHPWVAFGVLPIFAFANAGVPVLDLSPSDLFQPVPLGIMVGLVLGKVVGIMGMSVAAVRLAGAPLPEGAGWRHVFGASLLAGIGFTMSLFIASLAFDDSVPFIGLERLGILVGSLFAGVVGFLVLRTMPPAPQASPEQPQSAST